MSTSCSFHSYYYKGSSIDFSSANTVCNPDVFQTCGIFAMRKNDTSMCKLRISLYRLYKSKRWNRS